MLPFSSHGRKPRVPSTCACDLRELLIVPLRTQGYCGVGRAFVWSTCIIEHLLCAILRAKFWGFKGEFHKQRQTCKPIMTKYKVLLHSKEEPMRLQRRLLDGILDDRGEQRGRKGRKGKSCE